MKRGERLEAEGGCLIEYQRWRSTMALVVAGTATGTGPASSPSMDRMPQH